jgi:hypothetical protein
MMKRFSRILSRPLTAASVYTRLFLLVLVMAFSGTARAQADSSHMRISLLTCGVGQEIWQVFGHTAIRVIDSNRRTDEVYNYGMFNGFEEGFALKFMRGKLLYYVASYPYDRFVPEYIEEGRRVEEQVLQMTGAQKLQFHTFLENNLLEENKYYKYDFFYDNCATRIRDAFPKTFGKDFRFGRTEASEHRITFRQIINRYLYPADFERFGINLLLGSRIDKVMNNEDIMFLPDYLRDGIAGATVGGKSIATPTVEILPQSTIPDRSINWVVVFCYAFGGATVLGLAVKKLNKLGIFMARLLLFLTGFVGCFIVVMWLGTDHQACANNTNLLWALPPNLLLAFRSLRNKGKYAIVGIAGIVIALVLHLLRVQELPLLELTPILTALALSYGMIYRQT